MGSCFSSIRQTGSGSAGGRKLPSGGCWVTGGPAQGLAGGRGEGQEPWLSKLAVLAFHCRTCRHKERIHNAYAEFCFFLFLFYTSVTQGFILAQGEYETDDQLCFFLFLFGLIGVHRINKNDSRHPHKEHRRSN